MKKTLLAAGVVLATLAILLAWLRLPANAEETAYAPTPALSEINAKMAQTQRDVQHQRHEREIAALANVCVQIIEATVDCLSTQRVLRQGGKENDKLVPMPVVVQLRKAHPDLCIAVGLLLIGGEYAIFHRAHPAYMTGVSIVEGANAAVTSGQSR